MHKLEQIISTQPPAPRAAAVIEHLQASKRMLAALELKIPEAALAAAEGKPGGAENLAALREKIAAATFAIEHNAAARLLAERLDEEAVAQWKAHVQTLSPDMIVEGITRDSCCRRCTVGGCAITASDLLSGSCQHPLIGGALDQLRYRDSDKIQQIYVAACRKLGLMRLHA